MRAPAVLRVGVAVLALITQAVYAPPAARPRPPAPHEILKRPGGHDYLRPEPGKGPHREERESSRATTKRFQFALPTEQQARDKDDTAAQPLVFCAVPTGRAYENTFGDKFSAARANEMQANERSARRLQGIESRISNAFSRAELLDAIAAHEGKRPFILICHSEGAHENRDIPLGDSKSDKIKEDDLRSICSQHDTELFLVSCYSKDARITQMISYGEAFEIVRLCMTQRAASKGMTMSVGELKALLIKTAENHLKPGLELRVSYGAGIKNVVIVTGQSSGGTDSRDFPWVTIILFVLAIGLLLTLWIARKIKILLLLLSIAGSYFFLSRCRTVPPSQPQSSGIVKYSDLSPATQHALDEDEYKEWKWRLPASDTMGLNMSSEKLSRFRARFDREVGHESKNGFRMDPRKYPPRRTPFEFRVPGLATPDASP